MRAMRQASRGSRPSGLLPFLLPFALAPVLSVLGGCGSTPYRAPVDSLNASEAEPEWRWMPHSWEKLDAIETWMVGMGPRRHPELVAEAELLLAEGRLRFAQEEAAVLPAGTLRLRISAAESGLRRVLSDPFADESLRARARRALGEMESTRRGSEVAQVAGVLPRSAWRAATPDRRRLTPTSGRWRRITVHHSAMEAVSLRGATQSASAATLAGIQDHHMRTNGWGDIGYHFLIDPQGRIFAGRSLQWQGAHAGGLNGSNNIENIGICLLGDFTAERPAPAAVAALEGLLDSLRGRFGIPQAAVNGHLHFKNTACPGRFLQPWVEAYRRGRTGGTGSVPGGGTTRVAAAPAVQSAATSAGQSVQQPSVARRVSPLRARRGGGGKVR